MAGKPSLLDEVRRCLRLRHYSIRTEQAYVQSIKRFILFHHKRHPREMGAGEVRQYLSPSPPRGASRHRRRTKPSAPCSSSAGTYRARTYRSSTE